MASRALKLDRTRTTVAVPDQSPESTITEEEIAGRAYELWMERGCPEGTEVQDWFQAENELKRRVAQGLRGVFTLCCLLQT